MSRTIRAGLITPPGPAGIAVVEVIGAKCLDVVGTIFKSETGKQLRELQPRQVAFGSLYDGDELLDQVLVLPDSDQERLEIQCHGSPRIVQRLLLLLEKQGVATMQWPELKPPTRLEEEIAYYLPYAKTKLGVLALSAQSPGGLRKWVNDTIVRLEEKPSELSEVQEEIARIIETATIGTRFLRAANVVLAGPVNAGKSSLANALTGKTQSIASDLPGTTRDWTIELTEMNGFPIELIDTAGRRESNDVLEQHALDLAKEKLEQADLIILVIPADCLIEEDIARQKQSLPDGCEPLIIINKADLDESTRPTDSKPPYLHVSAKTMTGLDILRSMIIERLQLDKFAISSPIVFTERQVEILSDACLTDSSDMIIRKLKLF